MSSVYRKDELAPTVEPLPIPGGWAWSYYHGYKQFKYRPFFFVLEIVSEFPFNLHETLKKNTQHCLSQKNLTFQTPYFLPKLFPHSELFKSSRYSIGFKCTWGDVASWFNAGSIEPSEKYLIGIAAEFFLKV